MPLDKKTLPAGVSVSLTLLVAQGNAARYPVSASPAYVGRGEDMDVILTSPNVADSHARMTWEDRSLFLEDLGSGKPTRVNDKSIKRVKLQNGDILEFGDARLLLQLNSPAGAAADKGEGEAVRPDSPGGGIWLAGFSDDLRLWFVQTLGPELGLRTQSFRTGEEVLVALSRGLEDEEEPALIILDLRLPIINGVNVAVAARAFELGFNRSERIPIVFLFHPPESSGFDKVLKFCNPVQLLPPGADDSDNRAILRQIAHKYKS